MNEYQAWDWQAVRDRIIEAKETSRLMPKVRGMQVDLRGAWPETIQDYRESRTFRRHATPDAISRMEEVLRWIAGLPREEDRKLLHDFAYLKTTPRARIGLWCEKNGWVERIFRRRVGLLCQAIADDLNRSRAMRLDAEDCGLSEDPAEVTSIALPSRTAAFERDADAKPSDLPEHPDRKATIRRIERWNAARARRPAGEERL